jgi:hypothetical protein
MTANFSTHSFLPAELLSGAYNRTLTPFGFSEQRMVWEATDVFIIKCRAFMNAEKMKTPLLVHG